jgi:hypothetical protein
VNLRWGGFLAVFCLGLFAVAPDVAAECDGPFPSFRHAAATAQRVVVGQVTGILPDPGEPIDGRFTRFILDGRSVLDGDAVVIEVRDVISQPCAGYLLARPGDQVAIAFGGTDFQPPVAVNAIAWLGGVPPPRDGIETVTLQEVYDLVGKPFPKESEPPSASTDGKLAGTLIAMGVAGIALLTGWIGLRRRRSAHRS